MSSPSPAAAPLPVGFRFRPTDEELVRHYLKPKIAGRAHPDLLFIPDVDLSACEPWELPAKALIKSDDPEWFFFAPLDRKYPGGHRSNRSTAAGYWKATGKDRLIRSRPAGNLIGVKKTLVFHRGRAPRGSRTAWIMHEYRTTEPQLQQGQHGSFVLYRLFNKHEDQAPGSDAEDAADSPSTSSPAKPEQARVSEHVNSPSTSSPAKPKLVVKSENSALLMPVDTNEPKAPQENDPLLDVLAHLPALQPDQTFDGFPTVTSPMRPYTDHPFLGNDGAQDLSAYFNSIIDHQNLEEALSSTTGNADPNTTAVLMPSSSSNDKVVDDITAACCSSGTKILQKDTDDVNHDTGAQNDSVSSASGQLFHLYNQSQPHFHSAEMEQPNITAPFTAGSWTHPQQLLNDVVEPFSSDMANSDAFDGLEGWAAQPMMQQFTASNVLNPQQGTAARRIRLVHSVQRATVAEPVLTSHFESEDEAGSSHSTGNSSTTYDGDYANVISQTRAGEATHVQDGVLLPTQEVSSVEVTEKSQGFSFDGHISSNAKLSHQASLKQRLKQENTETSQNVRENLQDSGRVPREPSYRRQQHAPIASVMRLLCLAVLLILAFVCLLWK